MEHAERQHGQFPLMELCIRMLRKLSLWNQAPGGTFSIRGYLNVGSYMLVWVMPSFVFIVTTQDNVTLLLKAVTEQIVFFTIFYKFCSFVYNFRQWESLFYDLQRTYTSVQSDPDAEVQAVLTHVRKVAYYVTRYYCTIVTFNIMVYGIFPMIYVIIKYAITGTYSVPLSTPIEGCYFIPGYKTEFWIWLPFNGMLNVVLLLHGLMLLPMECFVWIMIYDIACLFRILRIKARLLGTVQGKDVQWHAEIENFVSLHDCTLRCASALEEILSGQMLFLYTSTIFSLCLLMTVISVAFNDTHLMICMLVVINYCMFQTFCFAMLGTELIEESSSVADAIFHSSWYTRSHLEQRDLAFVLFRAQRPVKLTAAKLFIVTRVSFAQVLKQAYTIFTLMSQFLGENVN
ncbi:odorant receptor 49b-like [Anopheles ziemanni]|uniref:odorant receptor 49b-like n=1 Tax=Anopheles coustani TaxID=139045 RepID=UPI00265803F9|nr:odorant receptor 49b-like [Anopheles coustani]XP_058168884.1 odorant receptor 49b-like [Anopheles ziemanni]